MPKALTTEKLKTLYLPPSNEFTIVDVPEMRFFMIDGKGRARAKAFADATRWLFTVVHPIKLIAKERMGKRFVEPPLECLWDADDIQDLILGNQEELKWCQMIPTPDWLTDEMFSDAFAKATDRFGDAPKSLRHDVFHEGRAVQIMHIGKPEQLGGVAKKLHGEFLPAQNLIAHGRHHEIYLTDPRRVAPDRMRTVLRQPVCTTD